ncbi:MAG: DNA replication/repair protein RecF [Clostridia bacterium]|nr:DNA replication/repair protein RecF [Clostridia bacterium]
MIVKKVLIKNFRNIENIEILPDEKMNVFYGPNAQGKTNLLEAIWLFTGAKSFRGAKDSEFVKFGTTEGFIKTEFFKDGAENEAEIKIGERRKAYLNGNSLASPGALAGKFCAIVFSPQDISLIKDGPSVRRRFLDTAIFQIYPKYVEIMRKYTRAVQQRNAAIKDSYYHPSLLSLIDVFDAEIVENGKKIIEYRKRYINYLKTEVPKIYSGISENKESLDISYALNCSAELLEERLKAARREDMKTGITSVGPHRDDIEFSINGISARLYGSQGQKRSAALSLKLAEAEILNKQTGSRAIALLDDVMSELDPARQDYVLNHIKDWQVFITCCDPSNTKNLSAGRIFKIENGEIK